MNVNKPKTDFRTPSIKDAIKGNVKYQSSAKKSNSVDNFSADSVKNLTDRKVTEKEFAKIWPNVFKEFLQRPDIMGYLKSFQPKLSSENTITLQVNNSYMEEELTKLKNKLIYYLKKHLKTSKFDVIVVYKEDQVEEKPTSDIDRVKTLISKNPVFDKFLKEFDLEIE